MTNNTPENITLHDLYRKECAKLFDHTPGTATISTFGEAVIAKDIAERFRSLKEA